MWNSCQQSLVFVGLLSSPSGSVPDVSWCPRLALVSLFGDYELSIVCGSLSGLAAPCCSALLVFYQHKAQAGVVHLTSDSTACTTFTCL